MSFNFFVSYLQACQIRRNQHKILALFHDSDGYHVSTYVHINQLHASGGQNTNLVLHIHVLSSLPVTAKKLIIYWYIIIV